MGLEWTRGPDINCKLYGAKEAHNKEDVRDCIETS